MASPAKRIIQQVRPILSLNNEEARRRVFSLYKAWYRSIPYIGKIVIIDLFEIFPEFIEKSLQKYLKKFGKIKEKPSTWID